MSAQTYGALTKQSVFYLLQKYILLYMLLNTQWYHPYDMIEDHYAKKIWLAPPQLYELLRLFSNGMRDYDTLQAFVKERARKSISQWLPVRINCTDGIVSVLPGNDEDMFLAILKRPNFSLGRFETKVGFKTAWPFRNLAISIPQVSF